jgi:hypothetical protein
MINYIKNIALAGVASALIAYSTGCASYQAKPEFADLNQLKTNVVSKLEKTLAQTNTTIKANVIYSAKDHPTNNPAIGIDWAPTNFRFVR